MGKAEGKDRGAERSGCVDSASGLGMMSIIFAIVVGVE